MINVAEKKFLVDLNLTGNKAKNFRLEDYADNTAPTSNFVGRMIYTTTGTDRIEFYNGSSWVKLAHYDELASGSVTSVGLTFDTPAGNIFGVSNSPITSSGNITLTLDTQSVNTVLAGPATGSTAAAPTFRSLVDADIPSVTSAKISDFAEAVADTVGAMVNSNTESGISVTYQDSDNTLDFDVADFTITLGGDLTGSATITNLGDATLNATIAANSVALGTDTTGNYMSDVSAGSGISVTHTPGEGSTATITNSDKGSSQNIFKNVAVAGQTTVVADTNDDTLTLAGSGITITTDASTDTVTFTNAGVTSATGTANEIEVSGTGAGPYTGAITIGLPDNVTVTGDLAVNGGDVTSSATTFNLLNSTVTTLNIGGAATTVGIGASSGNTTVNNNLIVTGNLTVSGTTTTLNTDTLAVEDNLIVLNSNITGTPTLNAGIEIERGDYTNASLYWDETANSWYVATPGDSGSAATSTAISLAGHTHSTGDITGLQEYVEDTIATSLTDSGTIDFSYTDNAGSAGTITAAVILASSNPYLSTASGLAVDLSTLEPKLVTDGFAKKYSTTIGDGSAQTFTVTHSLGTRAVTVAVYETASPYSEVEVEVLHTSTSVVTINTNSVPTSGQYTVVVVG